MQELLKTYNLCLEVCSNVRDRMIDAIESEGKADAVDAFVDDLSDVSNQLAQMAYEQWNEHHSFPSTWSDFESYGIDIRFIEQCYATNNIGEISWHFIEKLGLFDALCLTNSRNKLFEISDRGYNTKIFDEDASILEKLRCANSIASNLEAANQYLSSMGDFKKNGDIQRLNKEANYKKFKQNIANMQYNDCKVRCQKDWNYQQPPFSKEPWPVAIPTIAGIVGGVIGGNVLNSVVGSPLTMILPVALPILLGGGILTTILLINSKEEKEYTLRVKLCNDGNEKRLREFTDNVLNSVSYAAFDYMMDYSENLEFVMENLSQSAYKILCMPEFDFLPEDYKIAPSVLGRFIDYFKNKRVSTIKEAINLYISERDEAAFRKEMKELEQKRIAQEARDAALRLKNEKERNTLIAQLSSAVNDLRHSNEEAEARRKEDVEQLKSSINEAKEKSDTLKSDLSNAKDDLQKLKKILEK